MGVGGSGRWDGDELGRWRENAGEECGIWEGELEARAHLSKRSKAVCDRSVRIGEKDTSTLP